MLDPKRLTQMKTKAGHTIQKIPVTGLGDAVSSAANIPAMLRRARVNTAEKFQQQSPTLFKGEVTPSQYLPRLRRAMAEEWPPTAARHSREKRKKKKLD